LPAEAPDAPDPDEKTGPNVLAYEGRFERRRYPVERRVLALAAGDWNRDGKSDLAWVAEGGELTALWSGTKEKEERRTLDGLRGGCSGLLAADWDRDGHPDLLCLTPEELLGLAGGPRGFSDPVSLDRFESAPSRAFLVDLDGESGGDLLYAHLNADAPLRYRLAAPSGGFAPRVDLEMPQIRSVEVMPSGREVLAVFKLSGRLSELDFTPLESGRRALLRHTLRKGGDREVKRTFTCGDLDGDGAADVLAAEPETASLTVWRGARGVRGLSPKSVPSLAGLSWPKLADVDGDGRKEVLCISTSERMLGVARATGSGPSKDLSFPATYPIDGEPVALDAAELDGDGRTDAVVLVAQGEGRARKHRLEIWAGRADGALAPPRPYAIEGLKKTPFALRMIDLDRDGNLDALAFAPGEKAIPTLILQREGAFVADDRAENAPGLGILAGVGPDSIASADVDGDGNAELLVAQSNFVRALGFDVDPGAGSKEIPRAVPRVVAQFNAPAPDARLTAVAFADWNGDGRADLLVRDESTNELLALERTGSGSDGGLRVLERASSARLDFAGMATADLDGDGRADWIVYGRGELGLLHAGGQESGFEESASYEPREERVFLDQIAAGDVGGDARIDIVVTDLVRHALAILECDGPTLSHALGFEVYEKKSFEDENPEREPRELRCADVDGDGKVDIALLVHDKLILYPQE